MLLRAIVVTFSVNIRKFLFELLKNVEKEKGSGFFNTYLHSRNDRAFGDCLPLMMFAVATS